MRATHLRKLMLFALLSMCDVVSAAQWKSQCEKAAKSSDQQCQSAVDTFKAADAARGAAGKAASGTNVNSNSGIEKSAIDGNNADLQKAIGQCQQAKQSCDQQCDSALQQAQAAAQNPQMKPIAQPDVAAIPGVKQSQCDQPIESKIAELQAGKAPLDQQSKDSQKTKDESQNGGGAPQMPQMPKSESDKGTTAAAATQAALNCGVAGGSRFSDCNQAFTTKCMASMAAGECDTFSDRFCNLNSGAGASASATPATTNLVIDKRGEGVGGNYCSYALSARYCQTSGRESCPSCRQIYAQQSCTDAIACVAQSSASSVEASRGACPDDPYFLTGGWSVSNPNAPVSGAAAAAAAGTGASTSASVLAAIAGTSSASSLLPASLAKYFGGGGGGGSGGTGATGGGGSAMGSGASAGVSGASVLGSTREGLPNGIIPASTSGDGDLGGGGSWINSSERVPAGADVSAVFLGARRDAPGPMLGMSTDVGNGLGPSVFSVGASAIRGFCLKNRVTNCTKD